MVLEIKYSNTNTYIIQGTKGLILFDTGWAGSFPAFCSAMGEHKLRVQDIKYIFISHFHPDHMGIAQNIANEGAKIVVFNVQKDFIHTQDEILMREKKHRFMPIKDEDVIELQVNDSRNFLGELGIDGVVISTPGHSDDSISLLLDSGEVLVGDLNPLYEMELHKGTRIYDSWQKILRHNPQIVFYGHSKSARIGQTTAVENNELHKLVAQIIKYVDRGKNVDVIMKKTGADAVFIEDVTRMYLTHQNVGIQGIIDRIEIKGK